MVVRAELSQTDWGMISDAAAQGTDRGAAALERLVRRYWPAVFAFIRASGRDGHQAADLTQGFVCDVVLSRKLLVKADRKRGRFRALLMTALRNYLVQQSRHSRRRKRSAGDRPPISISAEKAGAFEPDAKVKSPEAAFAAQWSATLVLNVLDQVRRSCLRDGLEAHWTVFDQRVVRPLFHHQPPADYSALARQVGVKKPSQAASMIITVKRRFAQAMMQEVGRTVSSPGEVETEIRQLLRDLERQS